MRSNTDRFHWGRMCQRSQKVEGLNGWIPLIHHLRVKSDSQSARFLPSVDVCCVPLHSVSLPVVFIEEGGKVTTPPVDLPCVLRRDVHQRAKATVFVNTAEDVKKLTKMGCVGRGRKGRKQQSKQQRCVPAILCMRQPIGPCFPLLSYRSACASCVHGVTPQPLHASFLLVVSCFCLTDTPSSKDVCITEALQIGHACSIPLRATFEERQPARFCAIYRHPNLFTLWRPSFLIWYYNRTRLPHQRCGLF